MAHLRERSHADAALRVLFSFALAFMCAFGFQRLAFGAADAPEPIDGAITGIGVYAASGTTSGYGRLVRHADAEGGLQGQQRTPSIDADTGQLRLAAVALVEHEPADGESGTGAGADATGNAGGNADGKNANAVEERDLSGYVTWSCEKTDLVGIDPKTGTVTAKGADAGGTVKVTCTLNDDAAALVDPALAQALAEGAQQGGKGDAASSKGAQADGSQPAAESSSADAAQAAPSITFELRVVKHDGPYITSIEILDAEDNQVGNADRSLQLEATQTESYPLSARVTVHDPAEDRNDTYTSTPQQGISELTGGAFGDLTWTLESMGADGSDKNGEGEGNSGEDGSGNDNAAATIDLRTGVLAMNASRQATVTCTAAETDDGDEPRSDSITVRVGATELEPGDDEDGEGDDQGENSPGDGEDGEGEPQEAEPDGVLHVVISYNPKPRGAEAHLSSSIYGVGHTVYITTWEMSDDGGQTWTPVEGVMGDDLRVPTEEPYIGRMYRSYVTLPEDELGRTGYSEPVTIEEFDGMTVDLYYDMVHQGQNALFSTDVNGADASDGALEYLWEESADGGQTWTELDRGYLPTYSIYTELDRMGHQFRVTVTDAQDQTAVSNTKMLAAYSDETTDADDGGSPADEGENAADPEQIPPDATLSDIVDKRGETSVNFPDGKTRTMKPAGNIRMEHDADAEGGGSIADADDGDAADAKPDAGADEPADILIDPAANEKVAEEKAAEQQRINETVPGARWNPVYKLNDPTTQTPLEDNALAPLVSSLALAALAAGAIEKLAGYRRQKRPSNG